MSVLQYASNLREKHFNIASSTKTQKSLLQ